MRSWLFGACGAAILVSSAAAACGGGTSTSAANTARRPARTPTASVGLPARATNGAFGTECDKVSAGGYRALAREPVATATSHDPELSELTHAIRVAGLTTTLNAAKSVTVFAPDDNAFAGIGTGNVSTLMASRSDLARVLENHIVTGRVTPRDLASGVPLTAISGSTLHPAKADGLYQIDNATVVCGNVKTANATIYVINKVLVPSASN